MAIIGTPDHRQNPFGMSGFINGEAIGNQQNSPLAGLLNRNNTQSNSLNNGLSNLIPTSLKNSLANQAEQISAAEEQARKREEEEKEEDRLELSNFAQEAADTALEQARKSLQVGETNQIFVSEDGRFEASIDLRIQTDGSYDMELEVRFAESSAMQLENSQTFALPGSVDTMEIGDTPTYTTQQSLQSLSQRYTAYEQYLKTRDFEAHIFYEESKSVALKAESAFGNGAGTNYLSVAGEISHEYSLNISIHGEDINNFNAVANDLIATDNSETFRGFLGAVQGVLQADSSSLGSFVDATQSLLDSTREHIGAKLNEFFGQANEQYGEFLTEMGITQDYDYLENIGEDVSDGLNTFFDLTQSMLSAGALSQNPLQEIQDESDIKSVQIDMLNNMLQKMREERDEILSSKVSTALEENPDTEVNLGQPVLITE